MLIQFVKNTSKYFFENRVGKGNKRVHEEEVSEVASDILIVIGFMMSEFKNLQECSCD